MGRVFEEASSDALVLLFVRKCSIYGIQNKEFPVGNDKAVCEYLVYCSANNN